ncbi:hypothetical protein ACFL0F_02600, partial [Patescibacteria group bacterium]
DAYIAGGQILIDGVINGDLLVAGGSVTIAGEVTQDIRVAGGQVVFKGIVGQNVTFGAGNVDFTDQATIGGSITGGGGNVTIASPVGKDIKIGAGNLIISSEIARDVEAGTESLRLTPNALVGGNLLYFSEEDASIADDTQVAGEITKKQVPGLTETEKMQVQEGFGKGLAALATGARLYMFFSFLLVGLLFIHFYSNYADNATKMIETKPWASLGIGLAGMILVPFAFIILLVTIIGIPLAFVLLFAFGVYIYLSKLVLMLWLGKLLLSKLDKKSSQYLAFVVGLLIFAILGFIPVINVFVKMAAVLFGFGAMLLTCREAYQKARKAKIV